MPLIPFLPSSTLAAPAFANTPLSLAASRARDTSQQVPRAASPAFPMSTVVASSINEKAFVTAAPLELYSGQFFLACAVGGALACGPTHALVTPLDLVKCRRQVDASIYKSNMAGWRIIYNAEGLRGIFTGWGPTFYFKYKYAQLAGEKLAHKYRTTLYLAASASGELIADVLLCPMEALKVRMQTSIPPFAKTGREGFNKIYATEGLNG
ncbi:mitochondrial carrier domain-containing protein [Jimgerdemannia flammicorona]|nr:mitochondrial carrier domain-containing protein [Jimgerdemannia flammicorona]